MNRFSGPPVPEDRGFALVGYSYGRDLFDLDVRAPYRLLRRLPLAVPDLIRIVFNPARPGINLAEIAARAADDAALVIEEECFGTGCSLIERKHILLRLTHFKSQVSDFKFLVDGGALVFLFLDLAAHLAVIDLKLPL